MSGFVVSVSPHLRSKTDTASIMRDVIIALLPAVIAGAIIFGWRALLMTAVSVAACVLAEWCFEKLVKKPSTIGDLSAVVTGLLLAMSLGPAVEIWQLVIGDIVAIIVVKQLFGGIGQNFANPAVTGRIVMMLAFAQSTTTWVFPDAVSTATPLALIGADRISELPGLWQMFLGVKGGCIGEVSVLALLIGGVYLLIRRVITWHTPVAFIGTVFVLTALLGKQPVYQVLSGGLVLAAFFMATDYATTPSTTWGRVIFGVGCGLITVLIRVWGNYPEGVSFSILLMNILTPYISKWTMQKPIGGVKA